MPDAMSLPRKMRAAYIERLGSADEIRYGEFDLPTAGPGQILVRIEALAVNPVDTYIRSGAYHTPLSFPFIIGRDLAGEVVAVGAGVSRYTPGQRVWCNSLGYDGRQGSFAEYVALEQERVYPLPAHVDAVQAVATFHPAATAFLGLFDYVGGTHPGETILVGGGAGNVGSAVTQLAAAMGARVLGTAHGADDVAWLRACGASDVFDYDDPHLEDAVRAVAPDGVNIVWNTSGHDNLEMEVGLLARGGCLVLMAGMKQRPAFPVGPFYTKGARAVGFTITAATSRQLAAAAEAINALLAAGRLTMRIAQTYTLAEAAEAHRLVEGSGPAGKAKGRVIVVPERGG
ncbi:MAG TPA: NADPH:quinone reductase [Ktedonobacterales bacterium]|nr:NADPH:quinone reductase [Ktedonobacterales bacterium]